MKGVTVLALRDVALDGADLAWGAEARVGCQQRVATGWQEQLEVVVEGFPYTRRGCPIDYEASSAEHLIATEVTGGPWLTRVNLPPLRGGATYIFCAWADRVGDSGLYPEVTAQLMLNLHPKRRALAKGIRNGGAPMRTRVGWSVPPSRCGRAMLLCLLSIACLSTATAGAERAAKPLEFAAINRLFAETERRCASSWFGSISGIQGPFALAYLAGGQDTATVLRGAGVGWTAVSTISDEGLRCGLVPTSVIADLQLELFNEGPKPCSRY